jgi:glycosyltransferase involved in cell wall biosynthesis
MRVLRVITRLNIGGPSIQAGRLTTALEPYGYATRLVHGRLGEGEGDMRYLLAPESDVVFAPTLQRSLSPLNDMRAFLRLYREIRAYEPDIVHTHMAKAGLLARLAAVLHNVTRAHNRRAKIVHTYHGHVLEGYFGRTMTALFIGLERLLARASDRIVAISPAIRDQLLREFRIGRASQYRVVPLGFDLDAFARINEATRAVARQALHIPNGAPVVVTVGRLTAIKQHSLLLEATATIARNHPDVVVLIAGDGELRASLEQQAARLGLRQRVRFLGWRKDLATIYAASDVFALTSINEGTPVALIEAMASGVPGVSTSVGGVGDVIADAALGVLTPPGDVAALAAAIASLLGDPERRRRMGTAARAHVLGRYTLDRLAADIAALYADLLRERSSRD